MNPLMQELDSAFCALIHSFIPCIFQSARVMKSCPGLSPPSVCEVRESPVLYQLFCVSKAVENNIFFLTMLKSEVITAQIFSLLEWQLLTS